MEKKGRWSLGTRILIGVLAGIICGVLLGELTAPLHNLGKVYVGLLQMTVLPYVTFSLIGKIGGLTIEEARRLAGRAGVVQLMLWGLALLTVFIVPISLPPWQAGTFFSASLVEHPEKLDFLNLYIPVNPFGSLANNTVPAVVLFSVFLGVALIAVPHKQRLLEPLEVVGKALSRVSGFVVRLAPWGTFALTAGAAGTFFPSELSRLAGYVTSFTLAALFLTLIVLPGLVAAVTPFRYPKLLTGFREAGLTAFATGKLFAVLGVVIDETKRWLVEKGISDEEASSTAEMFVPLGYPFPNAGKLLTLLFIPFAAWFIGRPLELSDYPLLLSIGLLSLFGSPVAAIPFLLGMLHLPVDLFPLFLVAGIWCARVGDTLGAMHLSSFTLLTASWAKGWLRLHPTRLGMWMGVVCLTGTALLWTNHWMVRETMADQEPPRNLVERLELLSEASTIRVAEEARPNPMPLAPGENRLERIRRVGELRIGYVPNNPPFSYRNASGRLVGLDVDLAQRLAADLGVAVRFVPYAFADLPSAFDEDHFSVAVGGIPSSIEAIGVFHESGTYLELHAAVVVEDHRVSEFRTMDMIRQAESLKIGFVGESYLARTKRHEFPGLEVVQLPSVKSFLKGEDPSIDALLTTAETGAVLSMIYPSFSVVVPEGARARVPLVFAVHRDAAELWQLVDIWIRLKQEDATIERLYHHWILGEQTGSRKRRWSVVHDVLGWAD